MPQHAAPKVDGPPTRRVARRTAVLLRRRWRSVVLVVLVLVVVIGAAGWHLLRFEAPSRMIAGTAVTLRVSSGVPAGQAAGIEAGVLALSRFLVSETGAAIGGPVEVRVSRSRGCVLGVGPRSGPTAWAEPGLVCLNTAHPVWQDMERRFSWFTAFVTAHELVHTWQMELGCHRSAEEHRWQWLFEGMADQLAFDALERAGLITDAQIADRIRTLGGLDTGLGDLSDFETPQERTANAYPLFHLGARVLARSGADVRDFAEFCRAEAGAADWRTTFATAFGIPVDTLYAEVRQERSRLAS